MELIKIIDDNQSGIEDYININSIQRVQKINLKNRLIPYYDRELNIYTRKVCEEDKMIYKIVLQDDYEDTGILRHHLLKQEYAITEEQYNYIINNSKII